MEVLKALPRLLGLKKAFRRLMEERRPDVFVTVDYPDFNMRVAKEAKALGIRCFPISAVRLGLAPGPGEDGCRAVHESSLHLSLRREGL